MKAKPEQVLGLRSIDSKQKAKRSVRPTPLSSKHNETSQQKAIDDVDAA